MTLKSRFLFFLALLFTNAAYAQDELATKPIGKNDVLPYLEQVIAWQRAVADTELLPDNAREALLQDQLVLDAKKTMLKGFEFARAQALIVDAMPPAPQPEADKDKDEKDAAPKEQSRHERMQKRLADVNKKIADLQTALKARGVSTAQREKLNGDLKLAKAQLELLQNLIRTLATDGDRSGALADQVNALSRSVLDEEDQQKFGKIEPSAGPSEDKEAPQESAGMLRLSTQLFSLSRKKEDINNLIIQTSTVQAINKGYTASIRASLNKVLADGNALQTGNDAASMAAYRDAVDAQIAKYKQFSASLMPLREMNAVLAGTDRRLKEWSSLIDEDWTKSLRQLMIRIIILGVAIAVPLIFSELARRATRRYVTDPKRQRQIHIARRFILGLLLILIVLANFITEFGSLATFAGFITAGLAVAMQTVLVSLAGHFFFYGRYGVRAGDRITVAGVTGDVVQIGMLRLYVRELRENADGELAATGKVVAFPNSILFQPSGFYKHVEA